MRTAHRPISSHVSDVYGRDHTRLRPIVSTSTRRAYWGKAIPLTRRVDDRRLWRAASYMFLSCWFAGFWNWVNLHPLTGDPHSSIYPFKYTTTSKAPSIPPFTSTPPRRDLVHWHEPHAVSYMYVVLPSPGNECSGWGSYHLCVQLLALH